MKKLIRTKHKASEKLMECERVDVLSEEFSAIKERYPKVKFGGKWIAVKGVEFSCATAGGYVDVFEPVDFRDVAPESWWDDPYVPMTETKLVEAAETFKQENPEKTIGLAMKSFRAVGEPIIGKAPKSKRQRCDEGCGRKRSEFRKEVDRLFYAQPQISQKDAQQRMIVWCEREGVKVVFGGRVVTVVTVISKVIKKRVNRMYRENQLNRHKKLLAELEKKKLPN